jgi:hypothetical protein
LQTMLVAKVISLTRKCCCTIMLKSSPGCIDDLVGIRNLSYHSHLFVVSMIFLLCTKSIVAALPHLHKVVDFGHSVQVSLLCFFLQFQVVFSIRGFQYSAIARQNSIIGSRTVPFYHIYPECLPGGYLLSPANKVSPK